MIILALYMWRHRPARTVTVIILACAEWMLGYALELSSANLQTKVFWAKVQYLGIVIVPTAWFAYILQYTGRSKWLTRRILALLSLLPTIILLLAFTNEAHGLIWARVVLNTDGPFLLLDSTRGVGLLVYLVYSYILLLLSAFLIIQMLIRSRHLYRWQTSALLFGMFVPFLGSVFELSALNPYPHLDLEPFGFTVTGLTAAFSVVYLRLGDIVPVARETIIEGMSDSVIVLDTQNRIVDLNPAAQHLVGHAASEAIGQPMEQVWPEGLGKMEYPRDMAEVAKEVVLDKKDGQRTCDMLLSSLFDQRGRLISRVVVLRDITERKQMERALQKAHDELEIRIQERTKELTKSNEALQESNRRLEEALANLDEKNKELESFVYTVSHDLKAPLVSLEGFASMLLDGHKEALDEKGQLYLSRIQANVEKMGNLIQDLLELSRIGRIVHSYESVDVTQIIKEAVETLEIQLSERGTELVIQDNLPTITCDRVRIKQVFENLIDNANKFMGEENDKPRIEIGFHNNEDFFEFFVKDNGIGIQKEYQEKVFEIFARLGDVEVEGTGVGLAIVKKIVETHGGKIWLDSEVGKGTTVYFTLPKSSSRFSSG